MTRTSAKYRVDPHAARSRYRPNLCTIGAYRIQASVTSVLSTSHNEVEHD